MGKWSKNRQPCHRKETQIVFKLAKRLMSLTYKKGSEIFFTCQLEKGKKVDNNNTVGKKRNSHMFLEGQSGNYLSKL